MQPRRRQLKRLLTVVSLLAVCSGQAVYAQATPPINPNEDSPADEIGSNSLEGLEDTTDEIEALTNDIDSAIQEQVETVNNTVEETTNDLLENNEAIGQAQDAFDAFGSVRDAIGSIQETFSSIFDINRLFDLFSLELSDIFEDPLGGLAGRNSGEDSGNTVEISTGALGLPDPKQIEEQIENARSSAFEEVAATKTGGDGSPVIKRDLITQFERELADEVAAQTALTEEGQEKLRQNADAAKTALETSQELAADSEEQDVSQNILRNISTQLAAQQQTGSLDTVDAQLRARDDALRNKMLVDAVRELQGDRIQDRRETASAYSAAIVQGGQLIMPGAGINPGGI